MFFYYILTAYLIPCLYIYFRINYLLIPKGKKWLFSLIYMLLVAAFPVTELLLHNLDGIFFIPFLKLGFYTMPFMLYLFILILAFDLFLLLNLIFKWLQPGFFKSLRFRKYGLISALLIPSLVVIFGIMNFNYIQVSDYTIEVPKRSSGLQDLKIAFVSDFHIGDLTSISFVERFIDKMKDIQPDLILFGGDMLEGDRDDVRTSKIEFLFRQLETRHGIYGVFGNHERHGGNRSDAFFDRAGINILQDTYLLFDSSYYLVGRKDSGNGNRLQVEDLTKNLSGNYPVLLIDHRPTDMQAKSRSLVDVQLSGHTHHGQLFPFNLIMRHLYDLSWGYRKIGNTHFFVTSGIQLWGPPVRTIGKSEIMVIHIKFQ